MRYLLVGLLALLGVVFALSALSKMRGPAAQRDFAAALRVLRLLPDRLVRPTAAAVTVAEAGIALSMACAITATVGALPGERIAASGALGVAGLVLVVLTAGVALALRRGTGGRCACFGSTERPLGRHHLVRNGLLLLCVAGGLGVLGLAGGGSVEPAGALIATSAGVVGALLLVNLDDLVELFMPKTAAGRAVSASFETRR